MLAMTCPTCFSRAFTSSAIAFTGPLLPKQALAAMTITLDGKPLAGVAAMPSAASHVVVGLGDPRLSVGSRVALSIKPAVVSLTGVHAEPTTAAYVVSADKAVSMLLERIERPGLRPRRVSVPVQLRVRGSTAAPRE